MDNVSDQARAVAHYVPMAAAAAKLPAKHGPQHQVEVDPCSDDIAGVSYCGAIFDVAYDTEPADEEFPCPLPTIWAIKLNGLWVNAWPLRDTDLFRDLQSRLRAMPNNGDDEAGDSDRITAAMHEARQ
jgi:hypothetical protein